MTCQTAPRETRKLLRAVSMTEVESAIDRRLRNRQIAISLAMIMHGSRQIDKTRVKSAVRRIRVVAFADTKASKVNSC